MSDVGTRTTLDAQSLRDMLGMARCSEFLHRAGQLVNPLWRQASGAADVGQRLATVTSHPDCLLQGALGLGEITRGSLYTLQVGLSHGRHVLAPHPVFLRSIAAAKALHWYSRIHVEQINGDRDAAESSSAVVCEVAQRPGRRMWFTLPRNGARPHPQPFARGLNRNREAEEPGYALRWVARSTANPDSPLMAVLTLPKGAVVRAESCSPRMRPRWCRSYSLPSPLSFDPPPAPFQGLPGNRAALCLY